MVLVVLLGVLVVAALATLVRRTGSRDDRASREDSRDPRTGREDRASGADLGTRASDAAALWRRREQLRAERREAARQRRLPPLPAADVPPPGLTPLVPSPRTMRVEAARGIRDLEDWLAEQASA